MRVQKKKRATILTFAAIPREFLKPAPTIVRWSVDLRGRRTVAVDVGAGFKPALGRKGPSPPLSPRTTAVGSTAVPRMRHRVSEIVYEGVSFPELPHSGE